MSAEYERAFAERKYLEEDGVFLEKPEHWEMWEAKAYVYEYPRDATYTTKKGIKRHYRSKHRAGLIKIPMDIVRHLHLKNGDKIMLAVRRLKDVPVNRSSKKTR